MEHLVPADHLLAVLLHDRQQPPVEVRLQRVRVGEVVLLHERRDAFVRHPLLAFVLVAADVEVGVREERGHLAEEPVEELVDLFARRIERGLHDSPRALDAVRPRRAAELGMADEPAGGVPRNVELGHHADAAVGRVGDELFHLRLREEVPVRSLLVQRRIALGFDPEALVLRQVQVQDVELHRRHEIEVPLHDVHRHPVPRDVDEQPAPAEPRRVLNRDGRQIPAAAIGRGELEHRLEAAQRADDGGRPKRRAIGRHFECVALVLVGRRNRRTRAVADDREPRLRRVGRQLSRDLETRLARQAHERSWRRRDADDRRRCRWRQSGTTRRRQAGPIRIARSTEQAGDSRPSNASQRRRVPTTGRHRQSLTGRNGTIASTALHLRGRPAGRPKYVTGSGAAGRAEAQPHVPPRQDRPG